MDGIGISSARVNCFFQDRFDVIWIGTAQGGLNKLDVRQKQFVSYINNPYDDASISGNLINSILEDSKGYLWLASYNNQVCKSITPVNGKNIDQLRFERIKNLNDRKRDSGVLYIYEDQKGFIWFAGNRYISVFYPATKQFKKIEFELNETNSPFNYCRVIYQINANTMMFGGNKILLVKNPWDEIQKLKKPLLTVSNVFDEFGLIQTFLYDDKIKAVKVYTSDEGTNLKLSHNDIFSLYHDINNTVWIGTFGGGLNKTAYPQ